MITLGWTHNDRSQNPIEHAVHGFDKAGSKILSCGLFGFAMGVEPTPRPALAERNRCTECMRYIRDQITARLVVRAEQGFKSSEDMDGFLRPLLPHLADVTPPAMRSAIAEAGPQKRMTTEEVTP